MRNASDMQVTTALTISIFVFLTGLFAGLFFSTGISDENSTYLASLLTSSIGDSSIGFFRSLLSALVSNLLLCALMLTAIFSKFLCPVPFLVLWYKSFAVGFCSSLVYMSDAEHPFLLSITKLLPQNLILLPALICLSAALFSYSKHSLIKSKRPSSEKKGLQTIVLISIAAVVAGCIVGAVFSRISV